MTDHCCEHQSSTCCEPPPLVLPQKSGFTKRHPRTAVVFAALGLIPQQRNALVVEASVNWDYTTWFNIVFLVLAAYLVWRFVRTGGVPMLRMMSRPEGMQTH